MAQWAVITGAADGIGKALTLNLANRGTPVLAIDKDSNGLKALKLNFPELIRTVTFDLFDMDDKSADEIASTITTEEGVKYLIHNAAETPASKFGRMKRPAADRMFAVNVTAPALLTQAFVRHLSAAKGRVLHLGTALAHRGAVGLTFYRLSKSAFFSLVSQTRLEVKDQDILVASCIPGMTDTASFWGGHDEARDLDLPLFQLVERALAAGQNPRKPHVVAGFITWLLTSTSDEQFESKEWNILDVAEGDWKEYIYLKPE